jgi:hypothetical protein
MREVRGGWTLDEMAAGNVAFTILPEPYAQRPDVDTSEPGVIRYPVPG